MINEFTLRQQDMINRAKPNPSFAPVARAMGIEPPDFSKHLKNSYRAGRGELHAAGNFLWETAQVIPRTAMFFAGEGKASQLKKAARMLGVGIAGNSVADLMAGKNPINSARKHIRSGVITTMQDLAQDKVKGFLKRRLPKHLLIQKDSNYRAA